jgi:hypothetical protein
MAFAATHHKLFHYFFSLGLLLIPPQYLATQINGTDFHDDAHNGIEDAGIHFVLDVTINTQAAYI